MTEQSLKAAPPPPPAALPPSQGKVMEPGTRMRQHLAHVPQPRTLALGGRGGKDLCQQRSQADKHSLSCLVRPQDGMQTWARLPRRR